MWWQLPLLLLFLPPLPRLCVRVSCCLPLLLQHHPLLLLPLSQVVPEIFPLLHQLPPFLLLQLPLLLLLWFLQPLLLPQSHPLLLLQSFPPLLRPLAPLTHLNRCEF